MAGDWIKMRSGLATNPKVIRMARFLAGNKFFQEWWTRGTRRSCDETVYELCDVTVVTRVTLGSLLCVWGSANECANKDGFIRGITLFEVDEMAGVPGFGEAMALVGWCVEADDGVQFPNFEEHNTVGKERSSSAKTGAERTREWREKQKVAKAEKRDNGDVTVTSQRDHREEKRREDIEGAAKPSQPTPQPDADAPQEPEAIKVKTPRPLRQCPEAFRVTDNMIEWAGSNVPGVDLSTETAKFRDHTFKVAISDWPGAWRNWMRRAQGFNPPGKAGSSPADRFKGAI